MSATGAVCQMAGMYSGYCRKGHRNGKHFGKSETYTNCGTCSDAVSWSLSKQDSTERRSGLGWLRRMGRGRVRAIIPLDRS